MIVFIASAIVAFSVAMLLSRVEKPAEYFRTGVYITRVYPLLILFGLILLIIAYASPFVLPHQWAFNIVNMIFSVISVQAVLGLIAGVLVQQWLMAINRRNESQKETKSYLEAARSSRTFGISAAVLLFAAILAQDSEQILRKFSGIQTPVASFSFRDPEIYKSDENKGKIRESSGASEGSSRTHISIFYAILKDLKKYNDRDRKMIQFVLENKESASSTIENIEYINTPNSSDFIDNTVSPLGRCIGAIERNIKHELFWEDQIIAVTDSISRILNEANSNFNRQFNYLEDKDTKYDINKKIVDSGGFQKYYDNEINNVNPEYFVSSHPYYKLKNSIFDILSGSNKSGPRIDFTDIILTDGEAEIAIAPTPPLSESLDLLVKKTLDLQSRLELGEICDIDDELNNSKSFRLSLGNLSQEFVFHRPYYHLINASLLMLVERPSAAVLTLQRYIVSMKKLQEFLERIKQETKSDVVPQQIIAEIDVYLYRAYVVQATMLEKIDTERLYVEANKSASAYIEKILPRSVMDSFHKYVKRGPENGEICKQKYETVHRALFIKMLLDDKFARYSANIPEFMDYYASSALKRAKNNTDTDIGCLIKTVFGENINNDTDYYKLLGSYKSKFAVTNALVMLRFVSEKQKLKLLSDSKARQSLELAEGTLDDAIQGFGPVAESSRQKYSDLTNLADKLNGSSEAELYYQMVELREKLREKISRL